MRKELLHFQIKTKTQHQHIHEHKSVRRNLFKLTSNTAKNFNLKITEQIKTLPIMYCLPKQQLVQDS